MRRLSSLRVLIVAAVLLLSAPLRGADSLLNVSYDVAREFYQEYNAAFSKHWKETTGKDVAIKQSNAGSSKQVRSVLDGLEADVVTMNNPLDIEVLHDKGKLIPSDWAKRLPNNSVPNSST